MADNQDKAVTPEPVKPVVKKEPLPVDIMVQVLQGFLKTWAGHPRHSEGNPYVDPGAVDGVKGNKTEEAMRRYARSINLPENSSVNDLIGNFKERLESDPDFKQRFKSNLQRVVYNGGDGTSVSKDEIKGAQAALNALGYRDAEGKPLAVDGVVGDRTQHAFESLKKDVEAAVTKPKAEAGDLKTEFASKCWPVGDSEIVSKCGQSNLEADAEVKTVPVHYPSKANYSDYVWPEGPDTRGFMPMDENYIANTDIKRAKPEGWEKGGLDYVDNRQLGVLTIDRLGEVKLTREEGGDVIAHNITDQVTSSEGFKGISTVPVYGNVSVQMANGFEFAEKKAHESGKNFDDQAGILKTVKTDSGEEYKLWSSRSASSPYPVEGKDIPVVVVVTPEFEALNRDLLAKAAAQTPPELASNKMGLSNMDSTEKIQNTVDGTEKSVTAESVAEEKEAQLNEWRRTVGPHGRP